VRERRKYGRDNGATGVKMQFDYILCSKWLGCCTTG
jgi:hypothetical protein